MSMAEAATRLSGAIRLARFDASGLQFLPGTEEHFWRSFYAAVLVAPLFALLVAARIASGEWQADPTRVLLLHGAAYVVAWFAFPLAMLYVARRFGVAHRYFGLIVAYNWSAVIQVLLLFPVALAGLRGLLPMPIVALAEVAVFVYVLGYKWFIFRTALATTGAPAAGVLALEFVIHMALDGFVESSLRIKPEAQ